jgi:hypothetical protein
MIIAGCEQDSLFGTAPRTEYASNKFPRYWYTDRPQNGTMHISKPRYSLIPQPMVYQVLGLGGSGGSLAGTPLTRDGST